MPYGIYAERGDLYPTRPWLAFLQGSTRDHSRVFSTQGILYPDVASVYGLSDPRVLDAIYPARYLDYLKAFVSPALVDRFTGIDPNESAPKVAANPMFDLLGVRYLVYYDAAGSGPPPGSEAQFRLAYRGDGVKIYENLRAAPRAFVVHDVRPVDDAEAAATLMLTNKTFDPRTKAVIEAGPDEPRLRPCAGAAPSTATITSYAPSKVRIKVTSRCPGLLVLADQYFPGWSASVDAKHADVYATDATLRGVRVPAGTSTVELNYRPASFRNGMILFAIGLLTLLVLAVQGVRASPWWRAGRRRD